MNLLKDDIFNRFFPYKILVYADKIREILNENMPCPVVWHVYPSNICNLDCNFCIMRKEKNDNPKHILDKNIFDKIGNDSILNDIKLIHFSGGGEPLTNPYLVDFIYRLKTTKKKTPNLALSTNGLLFTYEKLGILNYLDHLRISVNAATQKTYSLLTNRPEKNFIKLVKNIEDIVSYAKKNKCTCNIGLAYIVTLSNWKEIYDFVKLASSLKIDFVHIRPVFYEKDYENNKLKNLLPQIMELCQMAQYDFQNKHFKVYTITYKFEGYWTNRNFTKCRSTPLQAVLCADNSFIVCQDVFHRFGDYYSNSFLEIWKSDEHKKAIEKIDLNKCPRCVETLHNQIIEEIFIKNTVKIELI